MKKFIYTLVILLLLTFVACQNFDTTGGYNYNEIPSEKGGIYPPDGNDYPSDEATDFGMQIIRSASVEFETDDYTNEKKRIKEVIKKYKAHIIEENENSYSSEIVDFLVVKVKADALDSLLNDLKEGNLKVISLRISNEDVTNQVIDMEARLRNLRDLEQQYLETLKKAKTVEEILQVRNYLNDVRTQIETIQAQYDYIKSQVIYSTVKIRIYQDFPVKEKFHFSKKVVKSFQTGWHAFLYFILFLIGMLPFWILLFIIIFVLRKRKKRKNAAK